MFQQHPRWSRISEPSTVCYTQSTDFCLGDLNICSPASDVTSSSSLQLSDHRVPSNQLLLTNGQQYPSLADALTPWQIRVDIALTVVMIWWPQVVSYAVQSVQCCKKKIKSGNHYQEKRKWMQCVRIHVICVCVFVIDGVLSCIYHESL